MTAATCCQKEALPERLTSQSNLDDAEDGSGRSVCDDSGELKHEEEEDDERDTGEEERLSSVGESRGVLSLDISELPA